VHFHFSTVVWGPWHTGVFLEVNLPSLLAPENLPAFAASHRVTYRIFTSAADAVRIQSTPSYKRASEIVPFEFIEVPVENIDDPIAMHHQLWRRSIVEAERAGAMILFVPPDVIWANGSFRHVAELASRGKRAIFMTYMRVISESCVPEARRRHLSADGAVLSASSRNLVDLLLENIHPLTLTYLRDSPNFPIHPEFILWSVPGEGFLMRVLVREMFAYDPTLVDLNQQALPAHALDPELSHFVNDSDDLFALSLAPLHKDMDWYADPQALDAFKIGSWWLTYDSPANDVAAGHHFYIHRGDRNDAKWRRVELQSDVLIRRLIGTREVLRAIRAITDRELSMARGILSAALFTTKLSFFARRGALLTLLLPTNGVLRRWALESGHDLLAKGGRPLLVRLLDHVLVGRLPPMREGEGEAVVSTLRGGTRKLSWQDGNAHVDGVRLKGPGFPLAWDWSYGSDSWGIPIDAVLPPPLSSG